MTDTLNPQPTTDNPQPTSIYDIPIHPAAELLPPMSAREYAALKADMQANGQTTPIVLFEGQVLDGRHRLRLCKELGLDPLFIDYHGADPYSYVASSETRRHLTDSQAAAAAVLLKPHLAEAARRRQYKQEGLGEKMPTVPGRARDLAGDLFGVSGRYVDMAEAIQKADPKLFDQVRLGKLTISRAQKCLDRLKAQQSCRLFAVAVLAEDRSLMVGAVVADSDEMATDRAATAWMNKHPNQTPVSVKALRLSLDLINDALAR